MKIRPFELTLLVVFGVLAIVALVLLKVYSPGPGEVPEEEYVGPVQIWGTVPSAPVNSFLSDIKEKEEAFNKVTYRYIAQEDFNSTLIEALADETGPDLLFISHEELVEQRKRIRATSYKAAPDALGQFRDVYLDGAQIFALNDGIYGTPILVDPLMMYWNKDILTNNGFLAPPKTWEELVNVQLPVLVDRGFDRTINRGVLAFGTYGNARNAYGTLSLLLIQGGSRFVSEEVRSGDFFYNVKLNQSVDMTTAPLVDILSFYLRFSQPTNTLYSWNRSFLSDRTEFISEDLVFYFGFGSEGKEIEELNPNLSFDIAEVPQGVNADVRRTYGKYYALSPLRSSDNLAGTFKVIGRLSADSAVERLAAETNMIPVKRSLVAKGSNDLYARVAYRSAPIAYGWLNPNYVATSLVLEESVSDVNENRSSVHTAVSSAETKISRLYE